MTPFLDIAGFNALWDGAPLSTAQTAAATLLLEVASNWIYAHKPGVVGPTPGPADPAAKLVTFEVVANALRYGKYAPLTSFSKQTGHRVDAGTLSNPESALDFTDRHRNLLGIPLRAVPMSTFYDDDFADPTRTLSWNCGSAWPGSFCD